LADCEQSAKPHAIQSRGNVRAASRHAQATTAWLLGLITTADFFLSVFGHELFTTPLMAELKGIEIEEIVCQPSAVFARPQDWSRRIRAPEFALQWLARGQFFVCLGSRLVGGKDRGAWNYEGTVVVFFLIASGNLLPRLLQFSFPVIRF